MRVLSAFFAGETSSFVNLSQKEYRGFMKNIYVGNLPWSSTEEDVRAAFERYGEVQSVKLITDRVTGRPRGFGFVEMDDAGGEEAINALDGTDFGGRNIKVNEARPKTDRGPRR
jgi:RNA recognition motif-containing protein